VPGLQLRRKQRNPMPGMRFIRASGACLCVGPRTQERACINSSGISCNGRMNCCGTCRIQWILAATLWYAILKSTSVEKRSQLVGLRNIEVRHSLRAFEKQNRLLQGTSGEAIPPRSSCIREYVMGACDAESLKKTASNRQHGRFQNLIRDYLDRQESLILLKAGDLSWR
jgi:hypothetical protein